MSMPALQSHRLIAAMIAPLRQFVALLVFALCALVLGTGCRYEVASFETTGAPSIENISLCRSRMHLASELELQASGFRRDTRGQSEAIWFRFTTPEIDPQKIFDTQVVDLERLLDRPAIPSPANSPDWWDIKRRATTGKTGVQLADSSYLSFGIEPGPDGCAVFVYYFKP